MHWRIAGGAEISVLSRIGTGSVQPIYKIRVSADAEFFEESFPGFADFVRGL